MSDANLTKILIAEEGTFGVVPGTPPTMEELRFLSSTLKHEKLTVMSEEIRSDRTRKTLAQVGKNATGDINTEFLAGGYNTLVLGALCATAWTTGTDSVTANATASTNTVTATAGTFSDDLQGAKYVLLAGFANPGNNGIKRIVSCSDTVMVVDAMSDDESGIALDATYKYARNGIVHHSYLIEEQYIGVTPDYYVGFVGQEVSSWKVSMDAQARIMQTFSFMGTQGLLDTSTFGDGSPTAASTRKICNSTSNVGTLQWNGADLTAHLAHFEMTLNNNLRNRAAIANETTLLHGLGLCAPDGTIQAYFETPDLLQAFVNHTSAALIMPITDDDGNLFAISMPNLLFPEGSPTIEGINTDTMIPLAYNAVVHDTLGYTIQVDQLDAPAGS